MPTLASFPEELCALPNWVCWRLENRDEGKPTKKPYVADPERDVLAKSNNPETWRTLEQAQKAAHRFSGVGFVLPLDGIYTGIDLDNAIDENGQIRKWAQDIVDSFQSYTEITPSGKGIRVLIRATLAPNAWHTKIISKDPVKQQVEIYSQGRYFTATGLRLAGLPNCLPCTVEPRQNELDQCYNQLFPPRKVTTTKTKRNSSRSGILERARAYLHTMSPSISGEGGHAACFRAACAMSYGFELTESETLSLLKSDFNDRCQPPWSDKELEHKAHDAARASDPDGRALGYLRDAEGDDLKHKTFADAREEYNRNHPESPATDNFTSVKEAPSRRVIHVTTEIADVISQLEEALAEMNPPVVYQRSGQLVHISIEADPPRGISRSKGATTITLAKPAYLAMQATQAAEWLRFDERSKDMRPCLPPTWAIQGLIDKGRWKLPPLVGIVETPTLRPDGSVIDRPGYDVDTGLVMTAREPYPAVPRTPTQIDARRAINELADIFADFPMVADCDRSAALAALLTVVCRDVITGPVPLFAVDARAAGTGKSLLVDTIGIIHSGRNVPRMAQSTDESEDRKRLLAIAIEGTTIVLIDNLTQPLGSGALDATLTSGFVSDRVLGTSERRTVAWRTVVFATGNNVQVRGDTGRRVIPINLDALVEQPEERTGWKHDPLLEWVLANRPRLVIACLTVMRAFFVAGQPQVSRSRIGSYEIWDDTIRAALLWLGCADPAHGRQRIRAESDSGLEAIRTLLRVWKDTYKNEGVTASQLIEDAQEKNRVLLKQALGAFDSKWRGGDAVLSLRTIVWALRKHRGRVVDGMRLEMSTNDKEHANKWAVEDMDSARSMKTSKTGGDSVISGHPIHASGNCQLNNNMTLYSMTGEITENTESPQKSWTVPIRKAWADRRRELMDYGYSEYDAEARATEEVERQFSAGGEK